MKLDFLSSTLVGWFAAAGALASQIGTSWPAIAMGIVGVVLAVLELEVRAPKTVIKIVVFNLGTGILSGPLLVAHLELTHPAALVLFTFMVAYVAHDLFSAGRAAVKSGLTKRLGAGK